jgi:tetratricopeptide (TPR) repeat protein
MSPPAKARDQSALRYTGQVRRWILRAITLGLVVGLTACAAAKPSAAPPPEQPQRPLRSADFERAIATYERIAAQSPALLNARLDYADFLLEGATGSCGQRLPQARSQLDRVTASHAAHVLFPEGWSRAAELEYRILLAEASCGDDPPRREHELQGALAAAQQAVSLYRDELDYSSMAVMQSNLSVLERMLGQNAAAITALQSAIGMARVYGLRDEAAADYQLLLDWQNDAGGAPHVATLMQDFPTRSTTLKFSWSSSEAAATVEMTHLRNWQGDLTRARATRALRRQVRADKDGWLVSYQPTGADFVPGVWPTQDADSHPPTSEFGPSLLSFPDIAVSSAGELTRVLDTSKFAQRMSAETEVQIRKGASADALTQDLMQRAISSMRLVFAPKTIEAQTRADYNLQTAMWIDATLRQGVPYEITASLPLPGFSLVPINQRLQFRYTHAVPCTRESAEAACAEIVVHARPETDALAAVLDAMEPADRPLHYAAATTWRIVTDPRTLTPYLFDERCYWYLSLDAGDPDQANQQEVIESQRTIWTITY